MDQLWSPWRSAYLQREHDRSAEPCFLCACARSAQSTEQTLVVASYEHVVVVMNRYPYNAGHLLIAPKVHHGDLSTLDPVIATALMATTQIALRVVNTVMAPHGCNVGVNLGTDAGAGVPDHLHVHVVPRWRGDTNFMPVLADIRMVGTRLEELWALYASAFQEQSKESS